MRERHKKLFPYDKNYMLKEAQLAVERELLNGMVERVKRRYLIYHNPLGLEDDAILKIKAARKYDLRVFAEFYHFVAGVYRYKYGDNQLEILFDGTSHYEKYKTDWKRAFYNWINEFVKHESFVKAVLELAVFLPEGRAVLPRFNRLKLCVVNFFDIKLYKRQGLVEVSAA